MRFGEGIIMEFMLLEDCCEILDSLRIPITASDREKGIYPYYGANGIQDYVSSYIFDDDLVLLAEDGGSFGSKTKPIAYRVSGKCWVNNHAHVLKPKEGIDVDFLCYSLMFYNTKGLVNGATRQKLTQSAMRKMKIPKLHIDIQLDIVKEIKSVISIIDIREKQLEKLSLLVRARFVEMFGDPIINEKNWDAAKLNVACNRIGDGLHGTPKYDEDGVYPFINGNNLKDGVIEVTSITKMVNKETYKKHFITMNSNTILLSINGTLGKLALYNGEEVMLGKSVCYCNLKPEINRKFVYGVMNIDSFKSFLESNARASTIKNVGLKAIRGFKLILPPKELQNKYVGFVEQVNKSKVEVQRALDEAQLLFDSLMQKYFG